MESNLWQGQHRRNCSVVICRRYDGRISFLWSDIWLFWQEVLSIPLQCTNGKRNYLFGSLELNHKKEEEIGKGFRHNIDCKLHLGFGWNLNWEMELNGIRYRPLQFPPPPIQDPLRCVPTETYCISLAVECFWISSEKDNQSATESARVRDNYFNSTPLPRPAATTTKTA